MDLQVIKVNCFDEAVFAKSGSCDTLKFFDIGVEPDWLTEIQLLADLFNGLEDHGSSGHGIIRIFRDMIF